MIKAKNIVKAYGSLKVLRGVNINIEPGEIVSLVGASGAGKTTFLQIAGTLDKADSGTLVVNGIEVSGLRGKHLAKFRNEHIGFVFQFHHLLPEFTALENVCIPAFIGNLSKSDAQDKAMELLDFLGLKDRVEHKPNELSGGEQQRVAVARALINQPAVVFADEPSGNLDSVNSKELHELFFTLRDKFQQTFLIATHNEELANMSDRKLIIRDGIIAD
ncbi:MAG: ABC transporter ATP-binding protein [Flavobacteriales bacterium]|nr:ABC transporter ATP-binding protein [Flavobacteriales bacterium]MBL4755311.1 ABC transporter ATP-binding protein [Flavobacteriales bacterium]